MKFAVFKVMSQRFSLCKRLLPALVLAGSCRAEITNVDNGDLASSVCTPEKRIYLNRWGGSFKHGESDSRTNTSERLSQDVEVEPIVFKDEDWDLITSCVDTIYSEFGFAVTDRSPEDDNTHLEVVFTQNDSLSLLGYANAKSVGGEEDSCDANPNMLSWVFAYESRGLLDYCHRAASAIAVSLTLDLTSGCGDVTSSTTTCDFSGDNPLAITDESRACERGSCRCDGASSSQNAYQRLNQVLESDDFCAAD